VRSVAFACGRDLPLDVDVFERTRDAWTTASESAAPRQPVTPSLLSASTPRWLRFSDDAVQRCIHTVRRNAESDRNLRSVAAWLDVGLLDNLPSLETLVEEPRLTSLVDLLAAALADSARATRAEALLIANWHGPLRARLRSTSPPAELALVVALLDGSPAEIVTAIHRAPRVPGPWSAAQLSPRLDSTLGAEREVIAAHAALLCDTSTLAERPRYAAWAATNARTLALYLAARAPDAQREQAVAVLANLSGSLDVAAISAALDGEPPPDIDAAVEASLRPALIELVLRRWRTPRDVHDRIAALAWLDAFGARPDHPLLRDGPVVPGEVDDLARELTGGAVSEALIDRLAARALSSISAFRPALRAQPAVWQPVVARWSPPVLSLLAPAAAPPAVGGTGPRPAAIDAAAAAVTLPIAELDAIGRAAAHHLHDRDTASLFLAWCRPIPGSRPGAQSPKPLVDAVRWLWHGGAPPSRPLDDEATSVIRALFHQQRPRDDVLRHRWDSTHSPGALLLLLRLCGEPVGEPTIAQLEQLLTCSEDVAAFVRSARWTPSLIPIEVCARGWQGVEAREASRMWRPAYARTMLSGAFAGLPLVDEAPLDELLDFFERHTRRARWELAAQWLRGRPPSDDGARQAWDAVVVPASRQAPLGEKQFYALVAYGEGKPLPKFRVELHASTADAQPVTVVGDELWLHPGFAALVRKLSDGTLSAGRREAYRAPYEAGTWRTL
jgi:hypothetical protein